SDLSLDAMRYLIGLGHKRIGIVLQEFEDAALLPTSAQESRVRAYRTAHGEAGLAVDESLIVYARGVGEDFVKMEGLLSRRDRPTAIVSAAQPFTVNLICA